MQRTNFLETPQQTEQVHGLRKSWIATEVLLVETPMFCTICIIVYTISPSISREKTDYVGSPND
jgi:hypothetical protein